MRSAATSNIIKELTVPTADNTGRLKWQGSAEVDQSRIGEGFGVNHNTQVKTDTRHSDPSKTDHIPIRAHREPSVTESTSRGIL